MNILKAQIEKKLKNRLVKAEIAYGELTLMVEPQDLLSVLASLRDDDNFLFEILIDVCGVDYPNRTPRFEVVYHLLSVQKNNRIRIKVCVEDGQAVPSAVSVFKAAGWWERETWDMYGIPFGDHPDLRRILTDYGFEGFPLRKDFPLTGYYEVRYDEERKAVVYDPVHLQQDYRTFDFLSPWEGTQTVLPGDEKAEGANNAKS